jgi:hypothetical protein
MCDCCKKIITRIGVEGPVGPEGPPGADGVTTMLVKTGSFVADEAAAGLVFDKVVTVSGTYVVELEYYIGVSVALAGNISTTLIKNGLPPMNPNSLHRQTWISFEEDVPEFTYTHTAAIVLAAGDFVGFMITTPATGVNGFLKITKIA